MDDTSLITHILRILDLSGFILIISIMLCSYEIYIYLAKEIYRDLKGYINGK